MRKGNHAVRKHHHPLASVRGTKQKLSSFPSFGESSKKKKDGMMKQLAAENPALLALLQYYYSMKIRSRKRRGKGGREM